MRHQPVAGVVAVLGVTRAGGHAGGGGAALAAFEQVVVAGAVAVDIGAVVVGVADGVRLGGHARAVDGLQGARQAVVELAPGGRLLLGPGGRVAAAAGAGTVAVTLVLPSGRPEAGDDPLVPGAGPIGAEVQLPAEPVGPVVAVLGAARRLGLGAGVVLLAVAAAAGDVAVGVVGGVAEGPDGGALLAEASLGDLVEASPGGLGVDRLLARVGQPRGVVGAGEVVVGVIAVAGRLAALVGPLLERPVSVVRPGHPPGGVERAGGVAALGGALGLLAQGGVVEADLGVGRVVGAADPARVEIGLQGAGAVLHAGGAGGGDRQARPGQVPGWVIVDRGLCQPAGGDVLLLGGGVAVGVIADAGLVAERVTAGQAAVSRVVVEACGEPHPRQRPRARTGHRGKPCPGRGHRPQVPSQVVAQVGDALVAGAGAVLGLADHPVQRVVVDQRGEVVGDGGRHHPLGIGPLAQPAGVVIDQLGALVLLVVEAGRLVHRVVAGSRGGPDAGIAAGRPEVRVDLAEQVVVGVIVGAGPQQPAPLEAGGLGRGLLAKPPERIVVEPGAELPWVAGVGGVVGVLDPDEAPVRVVAELGRVAQRILDLGGLARGVIAGEGRGRVAVGVMDRGDRARVGAAGQAVVVVGDRAGRVGDLVGVAGRVRDEDPPEVVGHVRGGDPLGGGHGRQQAQVVTGVGGIHRRVGVGQLGALHARGDLVLPRGQIAVGVVGPGGELAGRLGDLADLEVAGPFHLGGLVQRVGDLGDLAVGVIGVLGDPVERRGHGGHLAGQVVAEAGLLAGPVGAALELPPELRALAGPEIGEGGLVAARVAHAVDPGGLVGGLGVGVGRVGDGRSATRGGGVGEHQRPVGQGAAVGGGPTLLGEAQQVAVVVVVEVQRRAVVVADPLDLAAHVRLLGLVLGPVVDVERPAAGVGDRDDPLLWPARVVAGRGRLQGEGEGVAVAVGHRGRVTLLVVEERDLVRPGQRPPAGGRVGRDRAQVQVHARRLGEAGHPVGAGHPGGEPVRGAVTVGDHHVLVGLP